MTEKGRTTGHKILFGSAWVLIGIIVTATASIAIAALLARMLAPDDLGAYFLAFSIVSTVVVIAQFGLNQSMVKLVAESLATKANAGARSVIHGSFAIGITTSLTCSALMMAWGTNWLSKDFFDAPQIHSVNLLVGLWIVLLTLRALVSASFKGFQNYKLASLYGDTLNRVFMLIALLAAWLIAEHTTLHDIVMIAVLAVALTVFFGGFKLFRVVATLDNHCRPPYADLLTTSPPLMLTGLMLFIMTQADIWIIGKFSSPNDVALYGSAARLVLMVLTPLLIINFVIPPVLAELNTQGNRKKLEKTLRSAATFAGMPAMAVLLVFALFGSDVLGIIYGDYYRDASTILLILSLGKLTQVWSGASMQTLAMTGQQNILLATSVISGALAVCGGILSVSQYGPVGVATFSASGLALQSVLSVYFVRKKLGIRGDLQLSLINKNSFKELRNLISRQRQGTQGDD